MVPKPAQSIQKCREPSFVPKLANRPFFLSLHIALVGSREGLPFLAPKLFIWTNLGTKEGVR